MTYNHNNIPDGIKYKVIKWNPFILNAIVKKNNEKLQRYWTTLDYCIVEYNNIHHLVIEKTQEDIVEEIKERVKNRISKIRDELFLTDKESINLVQNIKHIKYISQFYDSITEMFIWKFPDLNILYDDLRWPLEKIYNIKEPKYKPKKKLYVNKEWEQIRLPDINDILRINILDVLEKLNIQYKKMWGHTYAIYENGNWTDWWRATTENNIVADLSRGVRPKWNPFSFVRAYLNLSNYDTYLWFKEQFNM